MTGLHLGDCLDILKTLPDNSVDLVLTDPPYGLAFMGKKWDYDVPAVEVWAECLRVLKPGGHLLAFAGTRTQHRMACRIEDAGFEIRDMIAWVYGSGFPKSLDVSKAIDKAAGAEREVTAIEPRAKQAARFGDIDGRDPAKFEAWINAGKAITIPATDAAREWDGWGTALKPALEPITMARKPLIGTVAANVLEYGTGGLNIDACRVGTDAAWTHPGSNHTNGDGWGLKNDTPRSSTGRWPANLIHDGSEEATAGFPQTKSGAPGVRQSMGFSGHKDPPKQLMQNGGDSGSASRFFYCAKASKAERDAGCEGNHHPTVKPVALMEYLCNLASRPGAVVLDPFMGSGTTGIACKALGREFIGIERDPEYFAIAEARIHAAQVQQEIFA